LILMNKSLRIFLLMRSRRIYLVKNRIWWLIMLKLKNVMLIFFFLLTFPTNLNWKSCHWIWHVKYNVRICVFVCILFHFCFFLSSFQKRFLLFINLLSSKTK
jgi:hypothetical protein